MGLLIFNEIERAPPVIDPDASKVVMAASTPTAVLSPAIQYELAGFHHTVMPWGALQKNKQTNKNTISEILLSVVRVIQLLFLSYLNWGKPGLKFGRSMV